MRDLSRVPALLQSQDLDGWLLYDFRGQNPTALAILGLEHAHLTRRLFGWVDRDGELTMVVNAIEQQPFEGLPGKRIVYSGREGLHGALARLLDGAGRVAMEYCPMAAIPYLSRVDAGTVELVRSFGVTVASSAELVQQVLCVLTEPQRETHARAAALLDEIKDAAFRRAGELLAAGTPVHEHDIQAFIMERFDAAGLRTDHAPIVAAGAHAGNPHYGPHASRPVRIERDQVLLIDLWARLREPADAVFADITWVGYTGPTVPDRVAQVFSHVAAARDRGLELIRERKAAGLSVRGFEVDRAVRDVIARAGHGEQFFHRTGHSIGSHANHGDGANLDDYETHDERLLVEGTCFSIEPGIYLPDFGIRSEIDVFLDASGVPRVYTPLQRELVRV